MAPTTIAFGTVNVNSTSPVQKVTLTNGKTTALTITSVGLAGPNAADFAAASACGTSLAANTNCLISVTFTPTIVGAESATLSIVDSDSTSPQTVALSGTGAAALPDFTISALPTSATVGTHGTVMTLITVTSIAGYLFAGHAQRVCLAGRLDHYLLAESDYAAGKRHHHIDGDDHHQRRHVQLGANVVTEIPGSARLALDFRRVRDGAAGDVDHGGTKCGTECGTRNPTKFASSRLRLCAALNRRDGKLRRHAEHAHRHIHGSTHRQSQFRHSRVQIHARRELAVRRPAP